MTTKSTNYLMQHYHNQNILLNKDDVGVAKQSHYSLPPVDFTYGLPLKRDNENAYLGKISTIIVTSNWAFTDPSKHKRQNQDFKLLNKKAIL